MEGEAISFTKDLIFLADNASNRRCCWIHETMSYFKTKSRYITRSDDGILQHGPLDIDNLEMVRTRVRKRTCLESVHKVCLWEYISVGRMSKNQKMQTFVGRYLKQQN